MRQTVIDAFNDWDIIYQASQADNIGRSARMSEQSALRHLIQATIPDLLVSELTILSVDDMCEKMRRGGWIVNAKGRRAVPYSAETYNKLLDRMKNFCKWLVKYRDLPFASYQAISLVDRARSGRNGVKVTKPVAPVLWSQVELLKPYMAPIAYDLFHLQYLGGMRPSEAIRFRFQDVEFASADAWIYSPPEHKKKKYGQVRTIFLGPRCQALLDPYMDLGSTRYLFPSDLVKLQEWQIREGKRVNDNLDRHGSQGQLIENKEIVYRQLSRYVVHAVQRAKEAGVNVEVFAPNQLRHGRATEVRERYDSLEAAAVFIQDTTSVAAIYAEKSKAFGLQIAREIA
ncbi:MAG: site-specific integrase [Bdellovibrionales bacterium]|nr:site-specific integrase [Bdellovibrionales bacterium]